MKRAFLVFAFLLFIVAPKAHNVVWFENPDGSPSSMEPLRIDPANDESQDFPFPVPLPPFRTIRVVPEFEFLGPIPFEEPCTVFVNLSGGANPPKDGPASCGAVEVTVTRPDGKPFSLRRGRESTRTLGLIPSRARGK